MYQNLCFSEQCLKRLVSIITWNNLVGTAYMSKWHNYIHLNIYCLWCSGLMFNRRYFLWEWMLSLNRSPLQDGQYRVSTTGWNKCFLSTEAFFFKEFQQAENPLPVCLGTVPLKNGSRSNSIEIWLLTTSQEDYETLSVG